MQLQRRRYLKVIDPVKFFMAIQHQTNYLARRRRQFQSLKSQVLKANTVGAPFASASLILSWPFLAFASKSVMFPTFVLGSALAYKIGSDLWTIDYFG